MKTFSRPLVASLGALLISTPAQAYNFTTHSRMTELAIRTMYLQSTPAPPNPAEAALFQTYLAELRAAPERLRSLRTGLPTGRPIGSLNPGEEGEESYPFAREGAESCSVRENETQDLTRLGEFRIRDFDYFPRRNASPCGLTVPGDDPELLDDQAEERRVLELVMGWQSGSVDDNLDDTVLWFRPTNSLFVGLIFETLSLAFELSVGAIALPFVCAYEAIFGDGCDVDDSFALARQYNAVDYLQGWVPGVGDVRDILFNGIWHFVDTGASINRFNDTRGAWLPEGGPVVSGLSLGPGAIDVAIIAATEITGLSLNAGEADGDNNYGQFDRVSRASPLWQAHTLGLLEWSPINNLAKYGWNRYRDDGFRDAAGLAWPLHALGDVVQPHHVIGSIGWGHKPYESFVGHHEGVFLPKDDASQAAQLERIRLVGFQWWKQFRNGEDIDALIKGVARQTQQKIAAQGNWVYNDVASTLSATSIGESSAELIYEIIVNLGHVEDLRGLLEDASGASLALLTVASTHAVDPGRADIDCPPGTRFGVTEDGGECLASPTGPGRPLVLDEVGVGNASTPPSSCRAPCESDYECGESSFCGDGCCQPIFE